MTPLPETVDGTVDEAFFVERWKPNPDTVIFDVVFDFKDHGGGSSSNTRVCLVDWECRYARYYTE